MANALRQAIEVKLPCNHSIEYPEVLLGQTDEMVVHCKEGCTYVLKVRPVIAYEVRRISTTDLESSGRYDPDLVLGGSRDDS